MTVSVQFDPFHLVHSEQHNQGFIRTLHHYIAADSIHLFCLKFNSGDFTDELFLSAGIQLPDDIKQAVKKRKAEFFAGRYIASAALSALGLCAEMLQVGIAPDRSPLWPASTLGSLTHTADLALCCIGKKSQLQRIGLDAEPVFSAETVQQVGADIYSQPELQLLLHAGFDSRQASTLIFSAKETLYKALYPQVRCFFGFEMARLSQVRPQNNRLRLMLSARFAAQHNLSTDYDIQFWIKDEVVHTLLMQ